MSNRVWDAEHGWHDGPAVDNAELVEAFVPLSKYVDDQLRARGYSAAYTRGYNDGAWNTYLPNADDNRAEYDRGHAAGVAYRAARASEGGK